VSSAAPETTALHPLWLSHHYAGEADRCTRVGSFHVCRRCLAMFAGFFPALALLLSPWSDDLQIGDVGLVLALAALAGIEFVQVVRGQMAYRARRVLVLSPAVGAVLAWLGVTGVRDGLGAPHGVLGAVALGLLVVLLLNGQVVRRTTGAA
jgi:hypothetical protein